VAVLATLATLERALFGCANDIQVVQPRSTAINNHHANK
jgi:hypothetical protein